MKKEKWEMTFNQYCEDFLNNSKYKEKYKSNKTLWEGQKKLLLDKWYKLLQERAEEGDIPEIVIRSLVKEIGESTVRRIFRGTKEKGLYSWEQTQIKKQYRETNKENQHKCTDINKAIFSK